MTRSLPRRRLLVAGVPVLLAGCFEEPDESAVPDGEGATDDPVDDDEVDEDGGSGETDATDDEPTETRTPETEAPPDRVDPENAGIVVTNVEITDVSDGGRETTVSADITVENVGRFVYGRLEFRVDAYTTSPNSREREAVGDGATYTTEVFHSGNRFDDGTRRFRVEIGVPSRDASLRPTADWYDVDAAVRRAEPSDVTE
ncbi:hypothetical protein [Halorubrum sp. DTA98]|uniref:hypothetical protein n=1 Tax=Halorubrum sp. DTA98 TaxID=3402163 RepID=UPI003AAE2C44